MFSVLDTGSLSGNDKLWACHCSYLVFCLSLADCCLNRSCVCSKYAVNACQMRWHRFISCLPHGWAQVDHGQDVLLQRGTANVVVTALLLWMQPSIHTLVMRLSAGENSCICYCKLDVISSVFILFLLFLCISLFYVVNIFEYTKICTAIHVDIRKTSVICASFLVRFRICESMGSQIFFSL